MALKKNSRPLSETHPHLAAQMNPMDNNGLTADDVSAGSKKIVVWNQLYFSRHLGKWFRFKWPMSVQDRVDFPGCPYLSGHRVWPGYNDLKTTHPHIAALMHPTKNGSITPETISAGSHKKVLWFLPYDDTETGEHFDFEWEASVYEMARKQNCPYLTNKRVWPGYNDLATKYPDIASQWDYKKNGERTPSNTAAYSHFNAAWVVERYNPATQKFILLKWTAPVCSRTAGAGCPYDSGQVVLKGYNDLATTHPHLLPEWDWEKNKDITPYTITAGSKYRAHWKCGNGHEWVSAVYHRTHSINGTGCPHCKVSKGEKRISDFFTKRNISFQAEYVFDDCVHKDKLRFDCAVFAQDGRLLYLVEYDGQQHYTPVDFSGKGIDIKRFEAQKVRDNIKTDYCRERRIPLVRISYKDYNNIEKILLQKIIRYNLAS